jgi:hypothetical protein
MTWIFADEINWHIRADPRLDFFFVWLSASGGRLRCVVSNAGGTFAIIRPRKTRGNLE